MEKTISELLEELKMALGEDDVQEETLVDVPAEQVEEPEITPVEQAELSQPEPFKDSMSLADTFDAKAKIARALDNLKSAIEEFKDATSEKVDLINDGNLITEIEGLDRAIEGIETALAAGELLSSELNDPFNAELPEAPEVMPEEELTIEDPNEHDLPDEEDEEDEGPGEDFDLGAGFTLFKDEREEAETQVEEQ